ncbi:unnamed protein product [Cyprideis torosa]|uniref:Uncharacterized protein n=1 Tax=Cyprideis torosa TaxID=163714 RepID=A0A7R8WC37_9CRUS|nr:unnamed protein product [Cyprideis torosa]CAG0892947.1 unnamed protein product [Cyprideis torosa]
MVPTFYLIACLDRMLNRCPQVIGDEYAKGEFRRHKNVEPAIAKTFIQEWAEHNVQWLADNFLGPYQETRVGALSPKKKMETFLRFLGDPGFQRGIGEDVGADVSTVNRAIHSVMDAVGSAAVQDAKPQLDNLD